MVFRPKGSKAVDPVLGSRLLNAFWLAASFGGATLQFRLLAQALATSQAEGAGQLQGTLIACLGIAWLAGQLAGRALSGQAGRVTWGIWLQGTALAWLVATSPGFPLSLPTDSVVLHLSALALLAFLLAQFNAAWMNQARPWPALRVGTRLVVGLIGVLVGLCVAWLLPAWSGTIGVVLLLPLLSLDLWPAVRCPLPEPGRGRANAPARVGNRHPGDADQPEHGPRQGAQAGWWWSWLASRSLLSLTLLESGATVILTSVWLVVPTLYAFSLERSQGLGILLWLLGGQLCGLLLGVAALLTRTGRSLLGPSTPSLTPAFRNLTMLAGWTLLVLAAICLGILGNPWLQAPWLLALALAVYTPAIGSWQRVYPRLLRGSASETGAGRARGSWTFPEPGGAQDLAKLRLARDELARRSVSRWERAFLLGMTLLTGALCDLWGIDAVLVLAGCALMGVVALAMLAARYADRPGDDQGQSTPGAAVRLGEFPETEALHRVPPSARAPVPLFRVDGEKGAQEPVTTAQQPVDLPSFPAEHSSNRYAAQYRPFPLNGNGEGGLPHDTNGSAIG
jgi:hypothetical protein